MDKNYKNLDIGIFSVATLSPLINNNKKATYL